MILTKIEIQKTQQLCFANPAKACAVAQIITDTCGLVSCATFAQIKGKSPRTIQYQAEKLPGIKIEKRKFIKWSVKPKNL